MRICSSETDARTLRLELVEQLRQAVGFDAYAWLLTDPDTSVGSSPLADVPCLPDLPQLIRLKYLTTVNRWTALRKPVALLAVTTHGDLARSLIWRELLSRYEVTDVASTVHRDAYGCWSFLDLWRIGGRFSSREAAFLGDVAAPVTAALRRAQALTFVTRPQPEPHGPVVLLLSPQLDVRAQTSETQEYLRILVPPDGDRSPVPAGAYNVAAQLIATELGVDANPPRARAHLAGGKWLTLRAARLSGGDAAERDIAVSIEQSRSDERAALFACAHGLSRREGELLGLLVTGTDTRDLATLMNVSEYTVNDHLKSIFSKTGVRSRQAVIARALGG